MPDISQLINDIEGLSLKTGYGIMGRNQRFTPSSRALFVGLGGTGNDALRRLKRIIYNRYNDVRTNFAFVGIDTDISEPQPGKNFLNLTDDEKVQISKNMDASFFQPSHRNMLPEYIKEWLHEDTRIANPESGAGGIRQGARALLFNSAGSVYDKLYSALTALYTGANNTMIEIFVLSGLSGGTGSGTTLDVAYMLRGVAKNVFGDNYKGMHHIHSYIFLPDISESNGSIPAANRGYLKSNAFAALKEIDYWMNIGARNDMYVQQYTGSFTVREESAPFDFVWLMSASNAEGRRLSEAFSAASAVVAEIICAWLSTVRPEITGNAAAETPIQSFMNNLQQTAPIRIDGMRRNNPDKFYPVYFMYSACGCSVIKLPRSEIVTFLACLLFEEISNLYNKAFDRTISEELVSFCDRLSLNPRRMSEKIKGIYAHEFKAALPSMLNDSTWDYEAAFKRTVGDPTIFRNFESRLAENTVQVCAVASNRILEDIENEFRNIYLDENRGPYYLNSFVQNGNTGLIAMLEGYKSQISNEINILQSEKDKYRNNVNLARRNGEHVVLMGKQKHLRIYDDALRKYYACLMDINAAKCRKSIYETVIDKLRKRVNVMYTATFSLLNELSQVFKNNIELFQATVNVQHTDNTDIFSWNLLELPEIMNMVYETLNAHNFDEAQKKAFVKDLLIALFDLISNEMTRIPVNDLREFRFQKNNVDINEFLADFIDNKFGDLVRKTMRDYINDIAQKEGMTLEQYLKDLYGKLMNDSTPMFNRPADNDNTLVYGILPDVEIDNGRARADNGSFGSAWIEFSRAGGNRYKAYRSDNNDSITLLSAAGAIAMFDTTQLSSCEDAYSSAINGINGKMLHLKCDPRVNELSKWSDWKNLPSVFPSDVRPEGPFLVADRARESEMSQVVRRLINNRILASDGDTSYQYRTIDGIEFDALKTALYAGEVNFEADNDELMVYKKDLEELRDILIGAAPIPESILNRFRKEFIIKDHSFIARVHNNDPKWPDPHREAVVVYSRSLNIPMELNRTERMLKDIQDEINKVDDICSALDSAENLIEAVIRSIRCGIIATDEIDWFITDEDGEKEVLATGQGVDKYPLCKIIKTITAKGTEFIEQFSGDAARMFVDMLRKQALDTTALVTLKAEIKRELKTIAADRNAKADDTNALRIFKRMTDEM